MMYELLVLSLLMHWPLHAYRIIKITNEIIGPEEQISSGTLSTLLNKLVQGDLITPTDAEATPFLLDRPARVFVITSAGRERFFELMLDITSHPGIYHRLFHIKALHLELLPPESQIFLVEHYLTYCQQFLRIKQEDERDMAAHPLKKEHMSSALREATFALIQLKTKQWQLELAWAQSLHEQSLLRFKEDVEETHRSGEKISPFHNKN